MQDSRSTKEKLLSNFFSMSSLQLASYIFPLLTIPYLIRTLGIENYGLLAFVTGIVTYFKILVSYGFSYTATKDVAENKLNKNKLSEVFSSVFFTQMFLVLISLLFILILSIFVESIKNHIYLYLLAIGSVLSDAILPYYFFMGIERMKYITVINIATKIFTTLCIFVFIHASDDYMLVPLIYLIFNILSIIYAIYLINVSFNTVLVYVPFYKVINTLKKSRHIFISNIGISLYDNTIVVVLGYVTNMTTVGYFTAAQKLVKAVISLSGPIYTTVYPHIVSISKKSKIDGLRFIKLVTIYTSIVNATIFTITYFFADSILLTLFDITNKTSISILQIMSILPLIIGLSRIVGIQTLMVFNLQSVLSKITLSIGLIGLPLSYIIINIHGAIGAAYFIVCIEFSIFISMFFYQLYYGINIIQEKISIEV